MKTDVLDLEVKGKVEISQFIEPHFHEYLLEEKYTLNIIEAKSLLKHNRFDLAFKLYFLELFNKDPKFSEALYIDHIRAFSLGKFIEPGQTDKNSVNSFIKAFQRTYDGMLSNGFDSRKTLIPMSKNNSIVNGAHRVASAIYLKQVVTAVNIGVGDHNYNYDFFFKRGVPQEMIDAAATKYIEYADNVHIAFIWPSARGHDKEIEKIIPNVVYRKSVQLTSNGAHNLLSQIYYGESWLGSIDNNFSGSRGKLIECFRSFDPVRVIVFQATNIDEVLDVKDRVRDIFNIGKHSIHITDTNEEAIRAARILFNDNSVHFLNHAKPNRYKSTHVKLEKFIKFSDQNNFPDGSFVVDSGVVLSLYGIREASDIDYLLSGEINTLYNSNEIDNHDKELEFHGVDKETLIYNSNYYFYFNDIKFISFDQVYGMKKNRNKVKDQNDCKLMESLIENNYIKKIKAKIQQKLLYTVIKLRAKVINIIKMLGLFELAKKFYKALIS